MKKYKLLVAFVVVAIMVMSVIGCSAEAPAESPAPAESTGGGERGPGGKLWSRSPAGSRRRAL